MSRIIVKNLPKKITEKKLQNLFSTKGPTTDVQLKYTKEGKFRQFAFIGYKTDAEAQSAKEYFHNTFIDASKIQVEICADLGSEDKPKSWSKHSKEKSLSKKDQNDFADDNQIKEKTSDKKASKSKCEQSLDEFSEKLQKDELFAEFVELNKARTSKPLWADDTAELDKKEEDEDKETSSSDEDEERPAKNKQLSDMEYLKSKMISTNDEATPVKNEIKEKIKEKIEEKKVEKIFDDCFTVKLKNLPYTCKKKDVKEFFRPLKIESLRLPPKTKGFAYVKFKSEKDMNRALNKNKGILDGHRINVVKYEKKLDYFHTKGEQPIEDNEKNMELLAESGRLFVRNLCYTVTEDELRELFSKFGMIEIHLPIDSYTKKGQGFAFVTYMLPEHAVNAFTKLDGTIFQGRVLHIIPGRPKNENESEEDINELAFKKKKEKKLKALSGSSHNWNTLFLDMNAVADVMSKKYEKEKSALLNDDEHGSIAVRMAIGETELVVETRQFLIKNGVQLDAFSQPASERSKTVIIAKNLPANTSEKELYELFSQHGVVSRVVLPPSGITALIEFQFPTEAKSAFTRLAYSRFRHLPLYLEWAPMHVFKPVEPESTSTESKGLDEETSEKTKEETNTNFDTEPGTTLFVKNLNFDTDEDSLRKHFKKCGPLHNATISKKKDPSKGKLLSMGFGFVQFQHKSSAVQALQELQHSMLDGHKLELKFSNRATLVKADAARRKAEVQEQKSSKILVRNIPFEVTEKDIIELFKEFGQLRSVRLPKKMSTEGTHRGFGFVDFTTKSSAKCAFNALCHSTHLLGRRLVLEWANANVEDVGELRKKTAKDFYSEGPKAKLTKSKLKEDVMLASAKSHT